MVALSITLCGSVDSKQGKICLINSAPKSIEESLGSSQGKLSTAITAITSGLA